MMTMRVDRRRYHKSARRSNSMNFSGTEDHDADKKVSSASSTGYSRIRRGTYDHSDYGRRKRSRYDPPNSSPWDSIAPLPTEIIRASGSSATRKSNLFNTEEEDGENGLSEDGQNHKITESNLLYINQQIATSVEPQWMGPMSLEEEMENLEEEMENLRNERERKKRAAKEQQRVSMPGFKSGSSTYFKPKKLWL